MWKPIDLPIVVSAQLVDVAPGTCGSCTCTCSSCNCGGLSNWKTGAKASAARAAGDATGEVIDPVLNSLLF